MKKKKTAVIFGVTGQDGSYLAYALIKRGYKIIGLSKNKHTNNLLKLKIKKKVKLINFNYKNYENLYKILNKINCDKIFFLAGETSVSKSENKPFESIASNTVTCLHILEYLRISKKKIRFFNASSGEIFGGTLEKKGSKEDDLYFPRNFYALSKIIILEIIKSYRKQFNIWACNGIFFNHESPLRAKGFVIKKIIDTAILIKKNKSKRIQIGNINISRDWGWAPDYVDAIIKIINYKTPDDFIIATGKSSKLKEIIKKVFSHFNLDYKKFLKINRKLYRKNESQISIGDSSKAKKLLSWNSNINIDKILKNIIEKKLF
jgi:GDPmannose 4,6-dehydratase